MENFLSYSMPAKEKNSTYLTVPKDFVENKDVVCLHLEDVRSHLFLLSLFMETSYVYPGVAVALPVNHRKVDSQKLVKKDKKNLSMFTVLSKDATKRDEYKTFQNSPLDIFFYSVAKKGQGDMDKDLCSISMVYDNNSLYPLIVDDVSVKNVTTNEFLLLSKLFNLKLDTRRDLWQQWDRLLSLSKDSFGLDLQTLKDFVHSNNIPFDVDDSIPLPILNRRLRSFIQYMTPICVAFIEGNHRLELATKAFYGFNLRSQNIFGNDDFELPNPKSTICLQVPVIVSLPISSTDMKLDDACIKHLRTRSTVTQDNKKKIIGVTYPEMICTLAETINNDLKDEKEDNQYLYELFTNKYRKKSHPLCKLVMNILNKVITSLWTLEPAKDNLPEKSKDENDIVTYFTRNEFVKR